LKGVWKHGCCYFLNNFSCLNMFFYFLKIIFEISTSKHPKHAKKNINFLQKKIKLIMVKDK
jgi:hypothetical protein